eukprot:TRINITY_DN1536_c0_g1_i2.p1 TRINITY_DN1536_c0_g1~~TRINITY_DN1536_c0_g1_i2.p1  ORF type:complete len:125 (-),score=28.89 TRINITY_DN1536_c0_g1_i2:242-616(-)
MRELKGHATRPKHGRCVAALVSLQHSSMLPGLNRSRIRDEVVLWCCEGVESLGEPEYQVQQHSNLLELPKPLLRVAFSGCSVRALETSICACRRLRDVLLTVLMVEEVQLVRRGGLCLNLDSCE